MSDQQEQEMRRMGEILGLEPGLAIEIETEVTAAPETVTVEQKTILPDDQPMKGIGVIVGDLADTEDRIARLERLVLTLDQQVLALRQQRRDANFAEVALLKRITDLENPARTIAKALRATFTPRTAGD